MIHNYRGVFSGQGNNDPFHPGFKGIALVLAVLMMLLLGIFREKIARRFDNDRQILGFKEQKNFGRTIGIIGTTILLGRLALYGIQGYPLYGEGLTLHICRLHILVMMLLMVFNKTKGIKYFTYLAIVGAVFGIVFNNSHSDLINAGYSDGNGNSLKGITDGVPGIDGNFFAKDGVTKYEYLPKDGTQLEKMSYLDKINSYGAGFDNVILYEFTAAHLGLIFFPLFIRAAYRQKLTNKEFFRMQLAYILATVLIGILNALTGNVSDPHGRANNGYMGLDANNDQKNTLGVLTEGPQNLFVYLILGYGFTGAFHALGFATAKVKFFERDKWYQVKIVKSKPREDFKNGFHKGGFKEIFLFRNK